MTEGGEIFHEMIEARVINETRAAQSEDVRVKDFDPFITRGIGWVDSAT